MRRLARLALLLAFALTRAAALECPMAAMDHAGAARAMHAVPMPGPMAAMDASVGSHRPAAPGHARADCGPLMACGAAVLAIGAAAFPRPAVRLSAAPARAPSFYASPVLATDSPPPRGPLPV